MQVYMFMRLRPCAFGRDVRTSGVQHKGFDLQYSVGVSVERGFLVLHLGMNCCPLRGTAGCLLFRGF